MGVFFERNGFAIQGCLLYPQAKRLYQPGIRWDFIPGFELDPVARNQFRSRNGP